MKIAANLAPNPFSDKTMPSYGPDINLNNPAYIHDTALLYGKVSIEQGSNIWLIKMACIEIGRPSH